MSRSPEEIIRELELVVKKRKNDLGKKAQNESSYTQSLFQAGMDKIEQKIVEECRELIASLKNGNEKEIVHETADLMFHVLVGLVDQDVSFDAVAQELQRRFGTSGIEEKASRKPKN